MNKIFDLFQASRRIVVKVGSSLLVGANYEVKRFWLKSFVEDIRALNEQGKQVVIVSSGAVGLGRKILRYGSRQLEMNEKQAAAACGQIELCSQWARAFANDEDDPIYPAQILLTLDDSDNRRRYLNARTTFETVLAQPKVIPIVNENDTVAIEEIRVGDNDRLAARVAQMISADLLVLLSDVQGLFDQNPADNPRAYLIPEVDEITPEIEAMASGPGSTLASGGMRTKVEAAKIAVAAGCHMLIAYGAEPHPLRSLTKFGECTWFKATANPVSNRKHWISGTLRAVGSYVVDDGAVAALVAGRSLLPAGVREVTGTFGRGDAVLIKNTNGKTIGKGLSEYSSSDAERIIGAKTGEIESILGFKYRDTLIHRDDMVLDGLKRSAKQ